MSATPLSDHITELLRAPDAETLARFHRAFLQSLVGLEFRDAVDGAPGERVDVSGAQLKKLYTPNGLPAVRACADPTVFAQRFGASITAVVAGTEVLRLALAIDGVAGVIVASAASEHSTFIERSEIPSLLELGAHPADRPAGPWWKFW